MKKSGDEWLVITLIIFILLGFYITVHLDDKEADSLLPSLENFR